MALQFVPKLIYNGTTLNLTWPQKLWTPKVQSVGGSNIADSGTPEAFVIRRDRFMSCEIRFDETEWQQIELWLAWAQGGNQFDFWFDKNVAGTAYTVYLTSPDMGSGEVAPTRDASYRHIYSLPIVIRTANNAMFNVAT